MKKIKTIVTTTIFSPSIAVEKFCSFKDWNFIIVGDLKTPHADYKKMEKNSSQVLYLSPDDQEKKYPDLSKIIGWNSIQRRNIGYIEAYKIGSEVIASVDDDNIPYDDWGKDLLIDKVVEIDTYHPQNEVFDPLSITNVNKVWHRGYPLELVPSRGNVKYLGKTSRKVLVQASLWDGDPDIDAMARLSHRPIVKFDQLSPYGADVLGPFNSQNTFISRKVMPKYAVLPHIGRMDDIWGSYIMQHYFPNSVAYTKASVYQERNEQDLILNLEKEILGYRNSFKFINDLKNFSTYLPSKTVEFWKAYREAYEKS